MTRLITKNSRSQPKGALGGAVDAFGFCLYRSFFMAVTGISFSIRSMI
jgi:hypothetical protein